jgi:hypothetical protein
MAKASEQHGATLEVPTTLHVWQPALRLVVVHVWADDDGKPQVSTIPVPGIRGVALMVYARTSFCDEPLVPCCSKGEPRRAGWYVDGDDGGVRHEPLVHVDGRAMTLRQAERHYFTGVVEVVACDWSAAEDKDRLEAVVRSLDVYGRLRRWREPEVSKKAKAG